MSTRMLAPAVLALAALALPVAATAAPLPSPSTTVIKPGVSIGGLKLGASLKKAQSAWGSVPCKQDIEFLNCTYGTKRKGVGTYSITGGTVSNVAISVGVTKAGKPSYSGPLLKLKTTKGIGLGSTRKAVKQAYPSIAVSAESGVMRLKGKGSRYTSITLTKNRVSTIAVDSGLLG